MRNNNGFTIIETLVAIAILMIAITGPLVVSNKSLTAALYAKDQTTATYIGQKSIEWIRNKKDNNIALLGSENWFNGISSGSCPIYVNSFFTCTYTTDIKSTLEAVVSVKVAWKEGSVSNEVNLVSNITKTVF